MPTTIDDNEVKSTMELAVEKKLLPVTEDWRVLVFVDEGVISSTLSHQIQSQ